MRAWRRGTREMDLMLGSFADTCLAGMSGPELDAFEALLSEGDHEILLWITRRAACPERYRSVVRGIRMAAAARLRAET